MKSEGHTPLCEDYASYETAKLLKEKGFDVECDYLYADGELLRARGGACNWNSGETLFADYKNECSAPTLQMAIKWLREVHNLHISVEMGFDVDNHQYYFFVPSICKFSSKTGEYQTPFGEKEFDTYEEACEAAIKYCLENLI